MAQIHTVKLKYFAIPHMHNTKRICFFAHLFVDIFAEQWHWSKFFMREMPSISVDCETLDKFTEIQNTIDFDIKWICF